MTEKENTTPYLESFPNWLKSLGADVVALGAALKDDGVSDRSRRFVAGAVNYLFKSLDLIPDGIEDLGFLDDAFVLRVAARLAEEGAGGGDGGETIRRLAAEAKLVEDFLGPAYPRLEAYVRGLAKGAARGRTVDEIVGDEAVRTALLGEVDGWASAYEAPTFTRDDRTLVKLRAFLDTKLPR